MLRGNRRHRLHKLSEFRHRTPAARQDISLTRSTPLLGRHGTEDHVANIDPIETAFDEEWQLTS